MLLVAFALSLLIHAVVALGVRYDALHPHNDDIERVTVEHRPRLLTVVPKTPSPQTPVPHTPPPQTPSPTAQPSAAHPRTVASVAPVGLHPAAQGTPATGAGKPTAAPSPTPTPVPSVSGACTTPEAPPTLLSSPPPPAFTPEVRHSAPSGLFKVAVKVDERGVVTDAGMQISTGNPGADLALVTMARGAHYAPATRACKPVPGEFVLVVRLAPW